MKECECKGRGPMCGYCHFRVLSLFHEFWLTILYPARDE